MQLKNRHWTKIAPASLLAVAVLASPLLAKKKPPAKPADPAQPAQVKTDLPTDLNDASMRVAALDTLYEFDLSAAQLAAFRSAASPSPAKRTPAKDDAKLADAMNALYHAILTSQADADIAKLRNDVASQMSSSDSDLDDDVDATDAARQKAAATFGQLTAGQIAAFLASHADEVTDPVEHMMSSLGELSDSDPAEEKADLQDDADDVAVLIAGIDPAKYKPVSAKVAAWLEANHQLTDDQVTARHAELEASAKQIVGNVPPMDVLHHWLEDEVAQLLSNPQLTAAVDAMIAAKEKAQ